MLDLLYPITPTIGAHQRRLPATIPPDLSRLSPVPLDPLPLDFEYFALGVLNVVKTSRRSPFVTRRHNRDRHAAGRRIVRRHDVVLTEDAGGLRAPMTTRHPVDRVQGTSYRGQTRVEICRRPRGVIAGSRVENTPAYPKSSSSFTDKLFKETGATQTEQKFGVKWYCGIRKNVKSSSK